MKRLFPLHIHISTVFLLLVLVVGGLIGGLGYKLSRNMLESSAADVTARINRETHSQLRHTVAPGEVAASLLASSALVDDTTVEERMRRLALLREALRTSTALTSIYVGYATGDFFFLRRLGDLQERLQFRAPEGARYLLQLIEHNSESPDSPPGGRFIYLDEELLVLREDDRPDYASSFDPRTRGWYTSAMAKTGQIESAPYVFFSSGKVGITLSSRSSNSLAVVGADIRLETLGAILQGQKVTPASQIALVNLRGQLIAHEDLEKLIATPSTPDTPLKLPALDEIGIPVLAALTETIKTISGKGTYNQKVALSDGDWRVSIQPLSMKGGEPLYLIHAIPDRELFAAAQELRSHALFIICLIMLLSIPATWIVARAISRPLRILLREVKAIRHLEFSQPIELRSNILEVDELSATMDGMKRTIQRFLDISQATAAEENFDRLIPLLLRETLSAADADAGVLYLADEEGLIPMSALTHDGKNLLGTLLPVQLAETGTLLASAIQAGEPRFRKLDRTDVASLGLEGDLERSKQGVAVPLLNRQRQLIGTILLLRRKPFESEQVSFLKTLSGSAASSLEARELIKAQKTLFEAFIQLIAGAIDAKSPYTGGHCARVPELTKMLARAACNDNSGPFKDFALDEHDWEAVHVAAWLHDCGKVTTPEYVVDKATKLETLYDRIHEIRMRFEVLKRDAEIACLKAIAAGSDEAEARASLAREIAQLDDDFAFVATCNDGGEFMAPEKLVRLGTIAARTWLRTLDDRIGISHEEKERKARAEAKPLPTVEALLADKPEHRFERRPQDRVTEDPRWGFSMDVPKLLYNRGELYNLSVGRGTLSSEERYKINEHIVQTLVMLAQLPFPKHLRHVPEIAGGHHEKMDGTGYPKRLTRHEMSPVARMMAIADIFEALTAVDRPYKKGKTLSEAIKIMSAMKKDRHIDPDLFDLFLSSGIYREYAEQFMTPEQRDEVDTGQYMSSAASA